MNNGNMVYYFPGKEDEKMIYIDQPLAAIITAVYKIYEQNTIMERLIEKPVTWKYNLNLVVFDANGTIYTKQKIPFIESGNINPFYGKGGYSIPKEK